MAYLVLRTFHRNGEGQQEQREVTQAVIKRDKKRAREQAKLEYRLDSIETAQDYFTILGWWHLTFSDPLDNTKAAKYGRMASRYCREHGFEIGQISDPRFGLVNTYPREVLELLFLD
jgi:anti-repressor protein